MRPWAGVVSAAATFGLVASALAWLTWCLATMSWGGVGIGTGAGIGTGGWLTMFARLTLGIVLLWVSCLSVTFVVACIFVLTPNAIAYEELLLQPILIFSGILFTTSKAPILVDLVGYLIPMKIPAQLLLAPASAQGATLWSATAWSLLSSALWFVLAGIVGRMVLVRARTTATLAVI